VKTFAIGDIHGACRAMMQCFERARFDYKKDRLIVMGDVCDGYPQVKQCIDELLKIKHCDLIIGNHDMWALDWALKGDMPEIWTSQGGDRTIPNALGGRRSKAFRTLPAQPGPRPQREPEGARAEKRGEACARPSEFPS
jgi:serine/threonine protein phosphatase 1